MKKIMFARDFLMYSVKGGVKFYVWLLFLGFFIMLWGFGNFQQLTKGMIVTGLNDQTTWGLYVANFVFLVGVAASAVTVVFPSYIYNYKPLKDVAVIGELVAIAAIIMSTLFITNHIGRPDRAWHFSPGIGIFNWPDAILAWDMIVLNVYLVLNFICAFYFLYKKYSRGKINKWFYMPLIYISIFWAVSIHTVTAFMLNTMATRPMWFHSIVPIKFIASAFAAGPAFIILAFIIIRKNTKLIISDAAINKMSEIMTYALGITLFLSFSEIVTELYPGTEHSYSLKYLMFGMHGLTQLVPWFWASVIINVTAFIVLLIPAARKNYALLFYLSALIFAGIWIEKGIGFILSGMVPTPIGEFVEYTPSIIEIFNCLGNWAIGLFIFTLLVKGAAGVLTGEIKHDALDVSNQP